MYGGYISEELVYVSHTRVWGVHGSVVIFACLGADRKKYPE